MCWTHVVVFWLKNHVVKGVRLRPKFCWTLLWNTPPMKRDFFHLLFQKMQKLHFKNNYSIICTSIQCYPAILTINCMHWVVILVADNIHLVWYLLKMVKHSSMYFLNCWFFPYLTLKNTIFFHFFLIRSILDSSKIRNYDLSLKYLIIVEHSAKKSTKMLNRITEILWKNGLINSNILSEDELGIWTLYNFIPYQRNCIELDHIRMASFTPLNFTKSMSLSMEQMYPEKFKNFNQCPLYAVAPQSVPFVKHCIINGSINYSGIDVNIVTQISRKLNFRIIYEYVNYHGMIFKNSTITGGIGLVHDYSNIDKICLVYWELIDRELLKSKFFCALYKLHKGDVNLSIGGYIQTPDRLSTFQASQPYLQASTIFCFNEKEVASSFTRLTASFQDLVWTIIGALLIAAAIIILLTKKLSRKWRHFYIGGRLNRTPILNMWTTLLGSPINNPRFTYRRYFGTFARTILILWIILWLLIRGGYQGILYKQLRRQRFTSAFDTIQKIQESDCKIISPWVVRPALTELFTKER